MKQDEGCPQCGTPLPSAFDKEAYPVCAGDYTVCDGCGNILRYKAEGTALRLELANDLADLTPAQRAAVYAAQRTILLVLKRE